jgi:hypothetical protein
MQQASENGARPGIGRALGSIAAALLFTAALYPRNLGHTGPHGGDGGFHCGGLHRSGFGGFNEGGFNESGFNGGGWHGGFAGLPHGFGGGHSLHRFDGWRNGRDGWWRVPGWDGIPIDIRSGVTILTTRTTASVTPPSIGITAPIRQVITTTQRRAVLIDSRSRPAEARANDTPFGARRLKVWCSDPTHDAANVDSRLRCPSRPFSGDRAAPSYSDLEPVVRGTLGYLIVIWGTS